jgi:hypothetical protein
VREEEVHVAPQQTTKACNAAVLWRGGGSAERQKCFASLLQFDDGGRGFLCWLMTEGEEDVDVAEKQQLECSSLSALALMFLRACMSFRTKIVQSLWKK